MTAYVNQRQKCSTLVKSIKWKFNVKNGGGIVSKVTLVVKKGLLIDEVYESNEVSNYQTLKRRMG